MIPRTTKSSLLAGSSANMANGASRRNLPRLARDELPKFGVKEA